MHSAVILLYLCVFELRVTEIVLKFDVKVPKMRENIGQSCHFVSSIQNDTFPTFVMAYIASSWMHT